MRAEENGEGESGRRCVVSCAASSMETKLNTTPMVLIHISSSSVYCNRTENGVLVWYVKKEERKEKRRRAERGG